MFLRAKIITRRENKVNIFYFLNAFKKWIENFVLFSKAKCLFVDEGRTGILMRDQLFEIKDELLQIKFQVKKRKINHLLFLFFKKIIF